MPTVIQDLYEEITNEIGNLKTDEDKDRVFINNLLRKIQCFSCDVYNNVAEHVVVERDRD